MNQLSTQGIVLSRTDFQEADRIITMLTPDQGKIRLIAKGVRRSKSKLAGGLELFSISDITYIKGRSEIFTLVSNRLHEHFGEIVKNIDRTMLGYDFLKRINKITEDEPDATYFDLLAQSLEALNNSDLSVQLVDLWFSLQLLKVSGHMPNLLTDMTGQKLDAKKTYEFNFDSMSFQYRPDGIFGVDHIKLLRLVSSQTLMKLGNIQGVTDAMVLADRQLVLRMAVMNQ